MKPIIACLFCVLFLAGSVEAQKGVRVFVGFTHTGTDQIGELYALEINQQLRKLPGFSPVVVPQDADVILLLTSIDPEANTALAGRRTAMAQVVTFPPLHVIDYAIDIIPVTQIKEAATSAILAMAKALVAAAKKE